MVVERMDPKLYAQCDSLDEEGRGLAGDELQSISRGYAKCQALDHYARYCLAAQYAPGRRVLDVACGVGYGSHLLKKSGAAHVVGLDNSDEAIQYARTYYQTEGVDYFQGDALDLGRVAPGPFDLIVSFETLEHIPQPEELIRQFLKVAHADTVFVFSVPNEGHLETLTNPYHCNKFDMAAFERMIAPFFRTRTLMTQAITIASVIARSVPETVAGLTCSQAILGRSRDEPALPDSFVAVCHQGDGVLVDDVAVHGHHVFAEWADWNAEMERNTRWAEEQRVAWMNLAEERLIPLKEMKTNCQWAEDQRLAWMKVAEERETYLKELDAKRLLAEEQSHSWQRAAEERASALMAFEAKEYQTEQQRHVWMKTAQMAEDWADQLGKVRLWLQEQLVAQSKELSEAQQRKDEALAELADVEKQCQSAKKALVEQHERLHWLERTLHDVEQSRSFRMIRWMRRKLMPVGSLRGRLAAKSLGATFRLLRPGR